MNQDLIENKLTELKKLIKSIIFDSKTKEEIIWHVARNLDKQLVEIDLLINEDYTEKIKEILGDNVFICNKDWNAWNTANMKQEDFELASENDELINEINNAVT